ncbi:MAG: HipA domain-containing protein, partial [Planctomycetota bacterium]
MHIEWRGATLLVGLLHSGSRGSAVAFEYVPQWLAEPAAFAIDPTALPLRPGPHHRGELFGAISDCGPDRWGRVLIERAVRKKVLPQKPYRDLDYVLALHDTSRIGALRFKEPSGPFLAANGGRLPPLVQLAALQRASDAIHGDTETAKDLRFLLGEGSPLGGARPKSAIRLADGALAIAKFPKPDDTRDIAAGEVLALDLAALAGIRVAEHRLVLAASKNVAVIT